MTRMLAIAALFSLTLSGCASRRGVEVRSDSATTYSLNVHNTRGSSIGVSYQGGGATRDLGTVPAGQTERFVVVSDATVITVYAETTSGQPINSYTITLTRVAPSTITVR